MQFSVVTKAALLFIAAHGAIAAPIAQQSGRIIGTHVSTGSTSSNGGSSSSNTFANASTDGGVLNSSGGANTASTGNGSAWGSDNAWASNDQGHSSSDGFSGSDSRGGSGPITKTSSNTQAVGNNSHAGQNSVANAHNWAGSTNGLAGSTSNTNPNGEVSGSAGTFSQNFGSGRSDSDASSGTLEQIWREKGTMNLNSHTSAFNSGSAGSQISGGGNIDPHMSIKANTGTDGNGDAGADGSSNVDLVDSTVHDFH